jgi:hypothetical protein
MHPSRAVFVAALGLAVAAHAQQPFKKLANQAAESLEEAQTKARRAGGACRAAVVGALDAATDHVYDLRKSSRAREAQAVKLELTAIASNASLSSCPPVVLENIQRALELVEEVRVLAWTTRQEDRDDRRDDRRDDFAEAPAQFAQLAALVVRTNDRFENESAVKVSVPELRLLNMRGRAFYLAARYRSYEGAWSEWVTTQRWSVPSDPFVWRNAFNHYVRASTLAEDDFSDGRFVAQVAVFDEATGRELASRQAMFRVRVPQLPPAPMMPPPPMLPPEPVQPPVARDCGTGTDVGCGVSRDGQWPMDAAVFGNVMQSMRTNANEMLRAQVCQSVFARNYATAVQFGLVLDLFENEQLRLGCAQLAAPRIVNPQHTLGYTTKWASSMMQAAFTQLMLAQGGGAMPSHGGRDCGTGDDPGCSTSRNGRWAMDGLTYQNVLMSLRSYQNELTRQEVCMTVFQNNALTALQLAAIMDLFGNELTRLEVAKAAAPRVVNPQHALGLAAKFRNSLLGRDFSLVYASQR